MFHSLKACKVARLALYAGAFASAFTQAREYPDLFATPRMKSMGRAMTAIVDDYSALYSNPAGLANMETWTLRLPDLVQAGMSPAVLDLSRKMSGVGGDSSVAGLVSQLSDLDGESACGTLDVAAMGYFSKRIAVALNPMSASGCFRIRTPSALFARLKTRITVDAGLSLAYAHAFYNNQIRVGFALRPFLLRGGLDKTLENTEILALKDGGIQDLFGLGWGFDMDLGVQANAKPMPIMHMQVKPMVGLALQNVLATRFSNRISNSIKGDVPPLERKLNLGVGASVESFGAFKPTVSVELRDFLVKTDSFIERLSGAIELALKPRNWFRTALRGHYYKGNFGGGLGIKLSLLELEAGTYAVNLGKGPGVGVDRILYGQMSFVW